MKTKVVNTIGLTLGIMGVLLIFIWGPPQPQLEPGISLGLEDATPIDKSGKTVAEYNQEVQNRRRTHEIMSRLGLIFVMVGFAFQLWGTWLPVKSQEQSKIQERLDFSPPGEDAPDPCDSSSGPAPSPDKTVT